MNTKYLAQYKVNQEWKTISCYEYKKLRAQEPTKWEKINLKSKPIKGIRYGVHIRKNSTKFCFNKGSKPINISSNRMTTTHEFVTEVIASLKEINLKIDEYKCKIIPDTIFHEIKRLKVYCTEQKKEFEYIPDLLIRYSNDKKLVRFWGGQIAIEVNVTHKPSDTKRKHFQFMGIPLLEIDASEDLKFKFEGQDVQEKDLIEYKSELKKTLSEEVKTQIKLRTYSNRELGNQIYKLKEDKNKLKKEKKKLEEEIDNLSGANYSILYDKQSLEEENNILSNDNYNLLYEKQGLEEQYEELKTEFTTVNKNMSKINTLKKELHDVKNSSFIRKLFYLFSN